MAEKFLLSIKDACERYSMGDNGMREEAKKAGAIIKLGKGKTRIIADVMDMYFMDMIQKGEDGC